MKTEKLVLPNISFCIIMDLIGMATFTVPGFGEFADIIWAPLSALIFLKVFGGKVGTIGGIINFLEEILPFADIIPSFTIAWFVRKNEIEKMALKQQR